MRALLVSLILSGASLAASPNPANAQGFMFESGSSLLASGLTIGLILALTRKRIGQSYKSPSDRPTSNRQERGAA